MTHRRQNFMGGAAILAGAVAVTKLLGALYKIPLGNLLDREGMAHFYAAYNVYSLLLVLSTAGLPVALSRMVSRAAAQRRYGAVRRCLHLGLALLAALGLVCSAVMCLLPEALAAALHDPDAAPALRTLGPAVLLVCLSAALRGYSQGLGDMVPTAAGQVAESAGKLLIGLGLCLYLLRQGAGTDLCAAGAIGGVTAGAGLGLLVTALLLPRRAALPEVRDVPPASSRVLRELLWTGIPITVGAAGMSLITLLDQALVTATLRDTLGYTTAETTALYGEYTFGMTLFMLPPSFIYPLSVSLMPAVSAALTRRDRTAAGKAAGAALKLTVLAALPAGVGLSVLARPILQLLYPAVPETAEAAAYHLTFLGLACVFVCLMVATNGILQANGRENIPIWTLLAGGALKIVTNYLMVGNSDMGIRGAPVGTLYSYALIVVLNMIAVHRCTRGQVDFFRCLWRPALCTAVMALAARSAFTLLGRYVSQNLAVAAAIAAAAAVYAVMALALGAVTADDLSHFKNGQKWAKRLGLR